MRSRYTAYALRDTGYVRRTWHPDTCPPDLALDNDDTRYLALKIHRAEGNEVEFTATLRVAGRPHRMRERSTFTSLNGIWVYMEGAAPDART